MIQKTRTTAGSGAIEINAIMQILPHRYPLLLVDRVLDCVPGKHITGLKNITRCEPFLANAAHDQRAMSHLLVIEALAQLSVILAFRTLGLQPNGNELMFFAGIDNAKFHDTARPGDQLLSDPKSAEFASWWAGFMRGRKSKTGWSSICRCWQR